MCTELNHPQNRRVDGGSHARLPQRRVISGISLLLPLAISIGLGCERADESRVGRGLLPPSLLEGGELRDTIFVGALADTDYQFTSHVVPSGGSTRLVAAREANFISRALLRFGALPTSDRLLRSSRVVLSLSDWEPASSPPRVLVYELYQGFGEGITGEDDFPAHGDIPLAEGVFQDAVGETSATFVFAGGAVDSLVRRWMDETRVNGGLLFEVAAGESGRVEFHSREGPVLPQDLRPRAEFMLISEDDTSTTDTTYWLPDRDTFLAERTGVFLAGEPERLSVGTAIPARALLRFDLIPGFENSVVHRATLTLNVDLARSHLDSLFLLAELVAEHPWAGEETLARTRGRALAQAFAESTSVSFELAEIARDWVMGEAENTGVRIRAASEGEGLSWVCFFSSEAPPGLKPELHVTVSPAPGGTP